MGHTSSHQALRRIVSVNALALTLTAAAALTASPASAAEHEVRPGENLTVIAERYGVSATELARLNDLSDPNHLLVGTRLQLPGGSGSTASSGRSSARAAARPSPAGTTTTSPTFTLTDRERRETSRLLSSAAHEFGVPSSLLKALTYTESRWRQDVVSRSGAIGVGQLLPSTAEWLGAMMDEPDLDPSSRADNIRLSARLLRYLLDTTGSSKRALASYYQGIGAVLKLGVSAGGARYAAVITSRQAWFT